MHTITISIRILLLFWGCTPDKERVDNFFNCLTDPEQRAYTNLVSLCDHFIESNYPEEQIDDGYKRFLDELIEADPISWKIDTSRVFEMSLELSKSFGKSYDRRRANFLLNGPLTKCLEESNRKRFSLKRIGLENLLKNKEKSGELSPNVLAGAMKAKKISPTEGTGKIIFVTEVLWRLLYLNSVKE